MSGMSMQMDNRAKHETNLDPTEVDRFARIADEWWDPSGKFAPLHKLAPARLAYLRDTICRHHGRDVRSGLRPLAGLSGV